MTELITFLLFTVLQAMFCNGLKGAMEKGDILEKPANFILKAAGPFWSKPIVGCIKCMASFWGGIVTYTPTVLIVYGFQIWQVPVFFVDIIIVSFLNWFIYKRT